MGLVEGGRQQLVALEVSEEPAEPQNENCWSPGGLSSSTALRGLASSGDKHGTSAIMGAEVKSSLI